MIIRLRLMSCEVPKVFSEYNVRRLRKCDKQLDMSVMFDINSSFTDGASEKEWQHWKQK